jgi:hypothetical protein
MTLAQDFPYDMPSQTQLDPLGNVPTDIAHEIRSDVVTSNTSILTQLRNFFRLTGTAYDTDTPALDYVKWIINLVLGFVSFISLILIIFAFYLIFFSKGEDAVKKAKKILTGVAIALGLLGLSWLIVSFFFNIFITTT